MTEILDHSIIAGFFRRIGRKISAKWKTSEIGWLVTRNFQDLKTRSSGVYALLQWIAHATAAPFQSGRFGALLRGSVLIGLFSHYEYGVLAVLALAPIVPTMVCVLLCCLTLVSYAVHGLLTEGKKRGIDAFGIALLLLLAVFGICSATSLAVASSIKIWMLYAAFMLFVFPVLSCGSDPKQLRRMIFIFVTFGLFVSLYGIYQQFFGDNLGHAWLDDEMFTDITVRVYSTLENPNVLGEYLLLLIPVCGAMVYGARKIWAKLYYLAVLGAACLCMIFTQSRGCWLGLLLAAAVFALLVDWRLVVLGIVGLMFLPAFLPQSILERFASIGNMADSSTSYRVYIWMGTLNMLRDYWACGLGLGQEAFNKVYPYYSYSTIIAPHAHNLYLQLLVETGAGGLLTFIGAMLLGMKKILVGYITGRKGLYGYLCAAFLAGLLGFLLQGMFDYVWYNYRVFLMFWTFIGMGLAARRCACDQNYACDQ